jgi:hypothetical protein
MSAFVLSVKNTRLAAVWQRMNKQHKRGKGYFSGRVTLGNGAYHGAVLCTVDVLKNPLAYRITTP